MSNKIISNKQDTIIDMSHVLELFNTMQKDAIDNGINMFNSHTTEVNRHNMGTYFYQFIKKHITITKKNDDVINV